MRDGGIVYAFKKYRQPLRDFRNAYYFASGAPGAGKGTQACPSWRSHGIRKSPLAIMPRAAVKSGSGVGQTGERYHGRR